ncbi:MAG: endonuclease [Pirellulaceae bacterium]|nr:MAG: endonuclease [Pirellulaceae bacterium]
MNLQRGWRKLMWCLAMWCVPSGVVVAQELDAAPERLLIMSWNVEWMFDNYTGDNRSDLAREQSAPSREYWEAKLSGVAGVIADHRPHIVALQEIEGLGTLQAIARTLRQQYQRTYRYAFIPGTDSFTEQDVGLLVASSSGLVSYCRHEQSYAMYRSGKYHNLSKHLVAHFRWRNVARPLVLMNVHLRATAEVADVRARQLELARVWLRPLAESGADVLLVGDLNTEEPVGSRRGDLAALLGGSNPMMVDLLQQLSDPHAATHLVLPRQFDRAMGSRSLIEEEPGPDWVLGSVSIIQQGIIRGDADGEEHWSRRLQYPVEEFDLSDHFPLLIELKLK